METNIKSKLYSEAITSPVKAKIKRKKMESGYTLSVLYLDGIHMLDLIEPPYEKSNEKSSRNPKVGLHKQGHKLLPPGSYRLKSFTGGPKKKRLPTFYYVAHYPRIGCAEVVNKMKLSDINFESENKVFQSAIWCGRVKEKSGVITPSRKAYDRFLRTFVGRNLEVEIENLA